jgi:hypothetical protein
MNMRNRTRALVLASLGLTIGVGAQTPVVTGRGQGRGAAPPLQVAAKGTGLILGQVLDASSGRPVPHAVVALATPPPPRVTSDPTGRITSPAPAPPVPPGVFLPPAAQAAVSIEPVETEDTGRFVFFDVPRGDYILRASAPGYVAGAIAENGAPRIIHVADGQRIGDAAIRLLKTITIGGRLFDEFGEPMVGVDVQLAPRRSAASAAPPPAGIVITSAMGSTVRTDDRGRYRFIERPPGDYTVMVTATYITTGGMPTDQMLAALAVLGGAPSGSSMGLGSSISASGSFYIGGSEVQPWGTLAKQTPPTKPGGRMAVYPTTFSPDALSPSLAQVISLGPGEERLDVDVHLRLVPTVRVSGRLVGPSTVPTLHELVRLIPAGGTSLTTLAGATDGQGRFVIVGVAAGQYTIIAERAFPPDSPHLLAEQSITVGSTDVKDIQLVLAPQKRP